ncbi:MAG TPA: AAA family ATPase [Bryobacteraceae bacterium]|nr:AAA family ATPase [Bryobacteraceae bacterium]
MGAADTSIPLIGRERERERVAAAFEKRQSLLILGPAGSGKSALIAAALAGLPDPRAVVSVPYSATLHHLLTNMASTLRVAGPARQTSVQLRGVLWKTLEDEPRAIVLDGVRGGGFPAYRFLQRLYFTKGAAIIAAARGTAALGALGRLFWDPRQTLRLAPLDEHDARSLFDVAAERFGLGHLDLEDFRTKAIEAAKGNPGELIEMCRLAGDPIYRIGTYIKFAPLRIDVLMRFR